MIARRRNNSVCRRPIDTARSPITRVLAGAAPAGVIVIAIDPAETEARVLLVAMTMLPWTFAIVYGTRSPWREPRSADR